jgi:hypothetical protein
VSYESIRLWCNKFGPKYAKRLKRRHHGFGDTFFIDEVFVKTRPAAILLAKPRPAACAGYVASIIGAMFLHNITPVSWPL